MELYEKIRKAHRDEGLGSGSVGSYPRAPSDGADGPGSGDAAGPQAARADCSGIGAVAGPGAPVADRRC